jgi:hypothetical protein
MVASIKDAQVGREIPPVRKRSYQRSLDENVFLPDSIHNNDYTRSKGYAGALTSSYVLCGYMSEMMVNFFGPGWLKGGRIALRFVDGGVQQGDEIICRGVIVERTEEGDGVRLNLDIWMEKGGGVKVAVGTASGVLVGRE